MTSTMSQKPLQPSTLPPLQNLPSWSRNTLGRGKVSKPIIKDRLNPSEKKSYVGVIESGKDDSVESLKPRKSVSTSRIVSAPSPGKDIDPYQRIVHLEKGIQFLKAQHGDILSRLHKEMDKLKAENKDLTFRLVMAKSEMQPQRKASGSAKELQGYKEHQPSGEQSVERKMNLLEQQNIELKVALDTAKAKNAELTQLFETKRQSSSPNHLIRVRTRSGKKNDSSINLASKLSQDGNQPSFHHAEKVFKPLSEMSIPTALSREQSQTDEERLPPMERSLTMDSNAEILLQVNINPDSSIEVHLPAESPRPPTLVECQAIIKHLQQLSESRAKDLLSLKANLREILSSGDFASEAYRQLLNMLNEDKEITPRGTGETRTTVQKPPVHFPALVPNVGTNIADRRRRTQALQRSRKKDLY